MSDANRLVELLILVAPNFNLTATVAFIDPFRALNYLEGAIRFRWRLASVGGGPCAASNGLAVDTSDLAQVGSSAYDFVVVSTSWSPEAAAKPSLLAALRRWARSGAVIGALDTGSFVLADAGLLSGKRATVHYEHIDALQELHADIDVSQDIFVYDGRLFTCSGGIAGADMALQLIRAVAGDAAANAAARYIFHPTLRPAGSPQNPAGAEPLGSTAPDAVKNAILIMEQHLEDALSVPEICAKLKLSHRQLDRLFLRYVGRPPALYYRDIRLDRARSLVTQTDMLISEVAMASGFASQVNFSRAYRDRFGLSPRMDRVEGRIPFEFRAWPMHRKASDGA